MRAGTIATSSFAHTAYVTSLLHNVCKKACFWWGNSVHMRWESNKPIWFLPSWCPTLFTLFTLLSHLCVLRVWGWDHCLSKWNNSLSMLLNLHEYIFKKHYRNTILAKTLTWHLSRVTMLCNETSGCLEPWWANRNKNKTDYKECCTQYTMYMYAYVCTVCIALTNINSAGDTVH